MKYRLVGLISLFLVISSNTQAQAPELSRNCSSESSESRILADNTLFFTMPSLDENPQLELWQANAERTSFTGLTFSPFTILQANPTGASIVAIVTQADYHLAGDTVYEHGGSEISEIILIDTEGFTAAPIAFPEEFANLRFLRRIQWVDDNRILLLSPEWYLLFILNLMTLELETIDLRQLNPPPYLVYAGGAIVPSLSGDYLLYTTVDPSLPLIGSNQEQALAWRIIETEGDFSLEYISGIGATARWLNNEAVVLRTLDNAIISINILGGTETIIYPSSDVLLTRILPSPDSSMIAFTRWLEMQEDNDFQEYSLVMLETDSSLAYDTCLAWIDLKKESWSPDSQLLAYIASDRNTTNLYVLDIGLNQYEQLLPRQAVNASIASRFVRVVGWK